VILSNGNLQFFWDLTRGNPYVITKFPNPASVKGYRKTQLNPDKLINEVVDYDYIALTLRPDYFNAADRNPNPNRKRAIPGQRQQGTERPV